MSKDDSTPLNRNERDLEKAFANLKGHKEVKHHILSCSACGVPLLDVLQTKPEWKVTLRYRALCPHCGDKSYPVEITGGVFIGVTEDDPHTNYDGQDIVGDLVTLKTSIGRKYGD